MTEAITALRAFNRFFMTHAGALTASFLSTDMTLPEARLLYEIATREPVVAGTIGQELGIDAGYLSRMLRRFATRGWTERGRGSDGRERPVSLTPAGRAAFEGLDARQYARVADALAHLSRPEADALVGALGTARALLGGDLGPVTVRDFRPGDMGGIVMRQGNYYARQYGWVGGLERLQLEVCADFLRDHVPGRTNCWIAERAGIACGEVFLVDAGDGVAQLRLLHVDPIARGAGLGRMLVGRCVDLARAAGYREIMLWTHSVLLPARRIYEAAGFRITETAVHDEFGMPVEGETWRMALG